MESTSAGIRSGLPRRLPTFPSVYGAGESVPALVFGMGASDAADGLEQQ